MSDAAVPAAPKTPTVYFIDDSATMREVIKIAFRKESINVITCHDAASALSQFAEHRPDAVITDVIMPDTDGYEVCQYVKDHPDLDKVPVILMSGVVNRQVAEKALAVKADELVRKPFQPQELIARVKNLLFPKPPGAEASPAAGASGESTSAASHALSGLFAPPAAPAVAAPPPPAARPAAPRPGVVHVPARPAAPAAAPSAELAKLRGEIRRLELLVTKLKSELEAERQYSAELESQLKVHQETP